MTPAHSPGAAREEGRGRRSPGVRRAVAGVALCCVGVAFLRSGGPLAATQVEPLNLRGGGGGGAAGAEELQGCAAALKAGVAAFERSLSAWQRSFAEGLLIPDFGKAANRAMENTLDAFDGALRREDMFGQCAAERSQLQLVVKEEVANAAKQAARLALDVVGDELTESLLKAMSHRKAPLRVSEKMKLLKESIDSYKSELRKMTPEWSAATLDTIDIGPVERALGELERGIEDSRDGVLLQRQWEQTESDKLLAKRAHGIAVSLDPELRVMVRPDGIGSFQVYGSGPVGPPNQPALVNVGVLNDGTISDVYREHPDPPRLQLQPAVKVNVDVR